ncbi:hypothetical protein ACPPVW_08400 [Leifsonia sp. McL0607]|uniref:hypothetical protein n=1 Tax=Leifsonia sp. McL0607 TaxID=3415672 RepID=UPI003CF80EA0
MIPTLSTAPDSFVRTDLVRPPGGEWLTGAGFGQAPLAKRGIDGDLDAINDQRVA